MLTLVEAISLAGDRAKQNDDAHGALGACAWVIDGATDLHDAPATGYASDAAWLATTLNGALYEGFALYDADGAEEGELRHELARASEIARNEYTDAYATSGQERWRLPTAAVLMISELGHGDIVGLDLGDCRCFALDADGKGHAAGGSARTADKETEQARDAAKRTGGGALLRDPKTMEWLRAQRSTHNTPDGYWIFGLEPEAAQHARAWRLELKRPAHLLICTDGFSALADRYGAYDSAGLVRAALNKGLQELGRELRAIESADAGGAEHPRWKPSDDATALVLRLT